MQCIILKLTSSPHSLLPVLLPIARCAAPSYVDNPWRLTDTARYSLRSLRRPAQTFEDVSCDVQLSWCACPFAEFDILTEPRDWTWSPTRPSSCSSGVDMDDEELFLLHDVPKFRYFKACRSSVGIFNAEDNKLSDQLPDH